jgi:hypothetical protein
VSIEPNSTFTLRTNVAGTVTFAIDNDDEFDEPIMHLQPKDQSVAFLNQSERRLKWCHICFSLSAQNGDRQERRNPSRSPLNIPSHCAAVD